MMNRSDQNWPDGNAIEITEPLTADEVLQRAARVHMYLIAIRTTDSVFPSVHESYEFLRLAELAITNMRTVQQ